ncbi:MAG: hypothetical protein HY868_17825 [Chloroflexi bacterium]|nr:hypothetical protein [Chloroflexota bacterium]
MLINHFVTEEKIRGMSARIESESIELPQDEKNEETEVDLTVEILADVLRIFAARGRAIREAREKSDLGPLDHSKPNNDELLPGEVSDVPRATNLES